MKNSILSVVIPTYNRGAVLLDTIELLASQTHTAETIYIVDQTDYANVDPVASQLQSLHDAGVIDWVRLDKPSIPIAMNVGLKKASTDYVLFLDDDVHFAEDFLNQHSHAISEHQPVAQVGQIIQPWQSPVTRAGYLPGNGMKRDLNFPFHSNEPAEIANCMAGNLCVNRLQALKVGGFDQSFEGVAYRFETEFCRRLIAASGSLFRFEPRATLNHLKINSGGTRDHAQSHLSSFSALHSVGDYYFAIGEMAQSGQTLQALTYIARRLIGSIVARFYLGKPWYIPVRVVSELWGLCKAIKLRYNGSKHISEG